MTRSSIETAHTAIQQFAIEGELVGLEPHERGHIHDTFISSWRRGGQTRRFLHQRLNDKVFTDIPALMHNVRRVTRHLGARLVSAEENDGFKTLKLVSTHLGRSFLVVKSGPWRTYEYIENTDTFDLCESTEQAFEAARAFGSFQAQLIDLDVEQLRETIPRFFSAPYRMRQLRDALDSDPQGRAAEAQAEIDFALEREETVGVFENRLRSGALPLRIVHGDTKLNNVLFDRDSGKAVCIVDLDTCMPAWSLYDFGDLVRFTAATSSEDETDLARVGTDMQLYHALVEGYLERAGDFLTREEIRLMPFAARLVTFTIGLRFLTDHLAGDVYFKVARPGHNLDRARVQFRMVEDMEQQARVMAVR